MKFLIIIVAFLATAVYAADKCVPTPQAAANQALLDHLVTYINKPANPSPPVPPVDPTILKGIGILPKHEVFSIFDERTWKEAVAILKGMLGASTFEDFIKYSEKIYPRVNEDLFFFCLDVAVVHRPDAFGVDVPRVHDVYPDKFLTNDIIVKIKNSIVHGEKNPVVNGSRFYYNDLDPYHRVAYFSEDLGMNSFHYHWHVLHPSIWIKEFGELKDRMGELFYWVHRQMVARFDSELLSTHLPRIQPFESWNEPIKIGYAPHLTIQRTGYNYMNRPEGLKLQNLPDLTIHEMNLWHSRILEAIHRHQLHTKNGTKIPLDEEHGIDFLGHLVASTLGSINRKYYGNLHSYAHVIAGRIADVKYKHMEDNGVMYDAATSARDPLFYSWHKFIDNIFTEYQGTLKPYNKYQLTWPEIVIDDFYVECNSSEEHNFIHTYYTTSNLKLDKGFDYTRDSEATVVVKHLDHEPFSYHIDVDNNAKTPKKAVFRIFLAPKYDEHGHPLDINEQRVLMIELDKFVETLYPGHNVIHRTSINSSVTLNSDQIFGDRKIFKDQDHCHCGWPDYLLVPRGDFDGVHYELFVMASDYEKDKVSDTPTKCRCIDSLTYCGTIYEKYPDNKPMGYPFDRVISAKGWEEFKTQNMFDADVTIKFTPQFHH